MIEEWARTGKPVQYMPIDYDKWLNLPGNKPPEWIDNCKYRFKPEVIKYKRFILADYDRDEALCVMSHTKGVDKNPECSINFVRWIDSDWKECEI